MKRLIMAVIGLMMVMCLLVPVACAKAPAPMPAPSPAPAPMPAPAPTIILPPIPEEVYRDSGAGGLPSTAEERMIVRTGDISLVVEDVIDAQDEIAQLAVSFGGYVVSS